MKILLGVNQFQEIAGSELLILEFAEFFAAQGLDVTICANFIGTPMQDFAEKQNIKVCLASSDIQALTYDLVITINHIAPLFSYSESDGNKIYTRFIFLHVDLNFSLSQPGLICEPLLSDEIWMHSLEAYQYFISENIPKDKAYIFNNAAPPRFWGNDRKYSSNIKTIAIVSNHIPNEIVELKEIFKKNNIKIIHYGINGSNYGRIGPKAILNVDVVITIGKTVQYCIATKTPVFVYDHFSGPGYLNNKNFARASDYNFSGRCSQLNREANSLYNEIIDGYIPSVNFMKKLTDEELTKYQLRPKLLSLLDRIGKDTPTNTERLNKIAENITNIHHEQALAQGAGMFYRMWRGAHLTVEHLRKNS